MNPFDNVVPLGAAMRDIDATLMVDVEGFEGPLDLLLALAKTQKVDLSRISILRLTEQYLGFIGRAQNLRLELAADYLVMAAWLAYLKSRLLLPKPPQDEAPSGEELAANLAFRLQKLEAMREAGRRLESRSRLGLDVFPRALAEQPDPPRQVAWEADLYDLLKAYAEQRRPKEPPRLVMRRRPVLDLNAAREALERLLATADDWCPLDALLGAFPRDRATRVGVRASTFAASLELAREGHIILRQQDPFGPLFVRRNPGPDPED